MRQLSSFGLEIIVINERPPIGTIRPAERHSDTLSIVFPSSPSFNEDDVTDKPPWIQNYPPFDNIQKDCIEKIYTSRIESTLAIDDLVGIIFHALIDTDNLENSFVSNRQYN